MMMRDGSVTFFLRKVVQVSSLEKKRAFFSLVFAVNKKSLLFSNFYPSEIFFSHPHLEIL
jgi:hypothetical protein